MFKAIIVWIILVAYIVTLCKFFTRQMILNPCYERTCKPAISMRDNYDFRCNKVEDIDPILGLQMMIVALKSGVAITRALDAVGSSILEEKGFG